MRWIAIVLAVLGTLAATEATWVYSRNWRCTWYWYGRVCTYHAPISTPTKEVTPPLETFQLDMGILPTWNRESSSLPEGTSCSVRSCDNSTYHIDIATINYIDCSTACKFTLAYPSDYELPCSGDYECKGGYCDRYLGRCKACKALKALCRRDENCCKGKVCVWGRCQEPKKPGSEGSECKYDVDCNPGLCCARQHGRYVCTKMGRVGESCYEPEGGLGYSVHHKCPCAKGLKCQTYRTHWLHELIFGVRRQCIGTVVTTEPTTDAVTTETITNATVNATTQTPTTEIEVVSTSNSEPTVTTETVTNATVNATTQTPTTEIEVVSTSKSVTVEVTGTSILILEKRRGEDRTQARLDKYRKHQEQKKKKNEELE